MTRVAKTRRAGAPARGSARYHDLKQMLDARRRELEATVRGRIRNARADGGEPAHDVRDDAESSQIDGQTDLDFALIELKSETLARVTRALAHLEAGIYGRCVECGDDIAEARLRAMPFAARCRTCEDAHEQAQVRRRAEVRPAWSPFGFGHDASRK